jgi:hypothetical protein
VPPTNCMRRDRRRHTRSRAAVFGVFNKIRPSCWRVAEPRQLQRHRFSSLGQGAPDRMCLASALCACTARPLVDADKPNYLRGRNARKAHSTVLGRVLINREGAFDVRYAPDSGTKADIMGVPSCATTGSHSPARRPSVSRALLACYPSKIKKMSLSPGGFA